MRDILVTLIVFGSLPFILRRPYIGILVWSWLSYMNPHQLAYGFARTMPFAQIVAITLLVAIVFSSERKRVPITGLTLLWIAFIIWMLVTTTVAIYPDLAMPEAERVMKIQFVTFLTLMIMCTRERIILLVWIIVLSIGFFSTKGGMFTLLTGGSYHVFGPDNSYIGENNALGLATLIIIPLMRFLHLQSKNRWVRRGLMAAMILSTFSALGSQSRGALIAFAFVALFFWSKCNRKMVTGILGVLLIGVAINFMPAGWHERMGTIETYEKDDSAMQRINAWKFTINLANDRLTGGGFNPYTRELFAQYAPNQDWVYVAHSIYFGVLADHGWLGLIFFLLILLAAWRTASNIIRSTAGVKDLAWAADLAKMIQVSLIAYGTGGAFLSLQYFDLPWHLVAILVLVREIVKKQLEGDLNLQMDGEERKVMVS